MKSGFYLRPDGEEIIELEYSWKSFSNINYWRVNNFQFSYDMQYFNIRVNFGNWIYLGE